MGSRGDRNGLVLIHPAAFGVDFPTAGLSAAGGPQWWFEFIKEVPHWVPTRCEEYHKPGPWSEGDGDLALAA